MTTTFPHAAGGANAGPQPAVAEMLDVQSVARLLAASPRHIFRLADAGKMPAPRKLGALTRWSRREILDWIEAGCPAVRALKGAGR